MVTIFTINKYYSFSKNIIDVKLSDACLLFFDKIKMHLIYLTIEQERYYLKFPKVFIHHYGNFKTILVPPTGYISYYFGILY